jgi:hypothetical protein
MFMVTIFGASTIVVGLVEALPNPLHRLPEYFLFY